MLITALTIAILVVFLVVIGVVWCWGLKVGLKWAGAETVSTGKIVKACVATFIAGLVISSLFLFIETKSEQAELLAAVAEFSLGLTIQLSILCGIFGLSVGRAFKAWLPANVFALVISVLLAVFVWRPFLFEAFAVPTGPMSPTILGVHRKGVCPECGADAYCTMPEDRVPREPETWLMICDNFHVNELPVTDPVRRAGDRILVAKYLQPRRWDLIAFHPPENPDSSYVMRLVGLPGETLHIAGGSVFINGVQLEVPSSIQGIKYLESLPGWDQSTSGSFANPATLGDGEFFVLGDFSARSLDSRFWQRGTPGHPPYAVPESNLIGVAVHIYWPLNRLRTFR